MSSQFVDGQVTKTSWEERLLRLNLSDEDKGRALADLLLLGDAKAEKLVHDNPVIAQAAVLRLISPGPGGKAAAAGIADAVGATVETMVNANMRKLLRKELKPVIKLVLEMAFSPKSHSSCASAYRPRAVEYYCGSQNPSKITCAVSGRLLPADEVTAGHIFQRRWPHEDLLDCNIDDPANILLMQKKIEKKFDNFEITVLPVNHKIVLLNKSGQDNTAFEYIDADTPDTTGSNGSSGHESGSAAVKQAVTWRELDGRTLALPPCGNQPSDTALAVHSKAAFKYAVRKGWCRKGDLPKLQCGDSELLLRFLNDSSSGGSGGVSGGSFGGDTAGTTGSEEH